MQITCSLPPDDLFLVPMEPFIEARGEIETENQGLIGAIKMESRKRINRTLCSILDENRKKELDKIITTARILEQEITQIIKQKIINDPNQSGFMSWGVGDGNNMNNIHFQRLLSLYQMRYGESDAQRVRDIFSNAENDGKYKLFIEYGETIDGSNVFIRRIWLMDLKTEK